ncbi:hypothetical protein BJ508DRAFT_351391 [Ascobolus immersus RN42]|uniref:Uncharacterized protein n=1 Tax=Ascobolus immersus RN42 TaxID=1160509 RepID=A0A3N4HTW9_ASCIM|nr:hypothetical protein BJ508DRAFT_351391 [Ascobolus immersus RN42]
MGNLLLVRDSLGPCKIRRIRMRFVPLKLFVVFSSELKIPISTKYQYIKREARLRPQRQFHLSPVSMLPTLIIISPRTILLQKSRLHPLMRILLCSLILLPSVPIALKILQLPYSYSFLSRSLLTGNLCSFSSGILNLSWVRAVVLGLNLISHLLRNACWNKHGRTISDNSVSLLHGRTARMVWHGRRNLRRWGLRALESTKTWITFSKSLKIILGGGILWPSKLLPACSAPGSPMRI